jgi:protein involved in sex pheromone biosynthesis
MYSSSQYIDFKDILPWLKKTSQTNKNNIAADKRSGAREKEKIQNDLQNSIYNIHGPFLQENFDSKK